MRIPLFIVALGAATSMLAQCDRWQQRIRCDVQVELDVNTHRYTGKEKIVYQNASPDTLALLYFHLYPNAFKPGSEMDERSRAIADPDPRVGERIAALSPEEEGMLRCDKVVQDGKVLRTEHIGTILRVHLAKPVLPGRSTTLDIDFDGQVPVQIRRSGRNSAEGVDYSMTQWYPKVVAYDYKGWHTDPYVGREFYPEWGDHTLAITIDSSFTVAATGVLTNANEIGKGYAPRTKPQKRNDGKLTWRFNAPRVHDLAWAADRTYKHTTAQVPGGPLLRFFHKDKPELEAVWKDLPGYMVKAFVYLSANFGTYPWPEYAFVQGGDGGMEYPMITLITGERRIGSLVGVSVHECVHSWYQGALASDETQYAWLDEGFTEYASEKVMRELFPGQQKGRPHEDALRAYLSMAAGKDHEPMSLHADHFRTNRGHSITAYSKGEFFLDQLGTVVGDDVLMRGLRFYFDRCAFKHPEPVDVRRSMEKVSGLQLEWYFEQWINTTRKLDQAVKGIAQRGDSLLITVERKGDMLMPVDLVIMQKDGKHRFHHIPLSLSLGARMDHPEGLPFQVEAPWNWAAPTYTFVVPGRMADVHAIIIDPFGRQGDEDRANDEMLVPADLQGIWTN